MSSCPSVIQDDSHDSPVTADLTTLRKKLTMSTDRDTKVIGYIAYSEDDIFCNDNAWLITGTDSDLIAYLSACDSGHKKHYTLKKTRFGEIVNSMQLGVAYAFDAAAYQRFHRLISCETGVLDSEVFLPPDAEKKFITVTLERST